MWRGWWKFPLFFVSLNLFAQNDYTKAVSRLISGASIGYLDDEEVDRIGPIQVGLRNFSTLNSVQGPHRLSAHIELKYVDLDTGTEIVTRSENPILQSELSFKGGEAHFLNTRFSREEDGRLVSPGGENGRILRKASKKLFQKAFVHELEQMYRNGRFQEGSHLHTLLQLLQEALDTDGAEFPSVSTLLKKNYSLSEDEKRVFVDIMNRLYTSFPSNRGSVAFEYSGNNGTLNLSGSMSMDSTYNLLDLTNLRLVERQAKSGIGGPLQEQAADGVTEITLSPVEETPEPRELTLFHRSLHHTHATEAIGNHSPAASEVEVIHMSAE